MKDLAPELPQQAADRPSDPSRRRIFQAAGAVGLASALPGVSGPAAAATKNASKSSLDAKLKEHVKNVVVIYLENRSFNNLFADFPGTQWPLSAVPAAAAAQKDRDGSVLPTLPKVWGGIVPTPQDIGGKQYVLKEEQVQEIGRAHV